MCATILIIIIIKNFAAYKKCAFNAMHYAIQGFGVTNRFFPEALEHS